MHKVRFITPKPIDPKKQNSKDPRDFIPVEMHGWSVEDAFLDDLAVVKDARGFWDVYDVRTGRFLNSYKYKTRKAAIDDLDMWAQRLGIFAEDNRDWYRNLCNIADTLAHELEIIRFAEYKGRR